jgi:hypothetical protein
MLWYPGQSKKLVVSCSFRGFWGGMLDIPMPFLFMSLRLTTSPAQPNHQVQFHGTYAAARSKPLCKVRQNMTRASRYIHTPSSPRLRPAGVPRHPLPARLYCRSPAGRHMVDPQIRSFETRCLHFNRNSGASGDNTRPPASPPQVVCSQLKKRPVPGSR